MATHSSILAWRIPGMGEPGGLPSMGSHRVGHDCSDLAAAVWYFRLCDRLVWKVIEGDGNLVGTPTSPASSAWN